MESTGNTDFENINFKLRDFIREKSWFFYHWCQVISYMCY